MERLYKYTVIYHQVRIHSQTLEGRTSTLMEVIELPSSALKCPKNLRCLCIGASESGKSTWIASLIKNKDKVFQSPGYAKFLFCSPNIEADASLNATRDIRYK